MLIPYDCLSEEALDGLIEQYLTQEHGLNSQVEPVKDNYNAVRRAVVEGRLQIVYSRIRNRAWLSAGEFK